MISKLLWWVLCINMWGFAVLGGLFTLIGVASFFVDFGESMRMLGQTVRASDQKLQWTVLSAAFGLLGSCFVYLQLTKKLRFDHSASAANPSD